MRKDISWQIRGVYLSELRSLAKSLEIERNSIE